MPSVDSPFGLFLMVDLVVFPVCALFLFLLLARTRRVERAVWAVVSQLQAERREHKVASAPESSVHVESAVPVHRYVANSMFGR